MKKNKGDRTRRIQGGTRERYVFSRNIGNGDSEDDADKDDIDVDIALLFLSRTMTRTHVASAKLSSLMMTSTA